MGAGRVRTTPWKAEAMRKKPNGSSSDGVIIRWLVEELRDLRSEVRSNRATFFTLVLANLGLLVATLALVIVKGFLT